jgi:hypothetical protein
MMTFTDSEGKTDHRIYSDMVPPINVEYNNGEGKTKILRNAHDVLLFKASEEYPFKGGMEEFRPTDEELGIEKDAINPAHYKSYMVVTDGDDILLTLEWLEAQQFKPYFRAHPMAFVQAVLMQADKYLSRMGQKDDESQEMLKAFWYTRFAAAFMKGGMQPIYVRDIAQILEGV